MDEGESGTQSCMMVKVGSLSGMWDVAFDPTVEDEGTLHLWSSAIPGRRLARCLSPRRPTEKDTWRAIRGPEVCEGSDQRWVMDPEKKDARRIVSGSCGE